MSNSRTEPTGAAVEPTDQDTRPKVPAHIVGAIQFYGDARADEGDSGAALRTVLGDLRNWAAALAPPAATAVPAPLTDEQIGEIQQRLSRTRYGCTYRSLARAIEAAHGIGASPAASTAAQDLGEVLRDPLLDPVRPGPESLVASVHDDGKDAAVLGGVRMPKASTGGAAGNPAGPVGYAPAAEPPTTPYPAPPTPPADWDTWALNAAKGVALGDLGLPLSQRVARIQVALIDAMRYAAGK